MDIHFVFEIVLPDLSAWLNALVIAIVAFVGYKAFKYEYRWRKRAEAYEHILYKIRDVKYELNNAIIIGDRKYKESVHELLKVYYANKLFLDYRAINIIEKFFDDTDIIIKSNIIITEKAEKTSRRMLEVMDEFTAWGRVKLKIKAY